VDELRSKVSEHELGARGAEAAARAATCDAENLRASLERAAAALSERDEAIACLRDKAASLAAHLSSARDALAEAHAR
jgi:chromosome segregation ATPase